MPPNLQPFIAAILWLRFVVEIVSPPNACRNSAGVRYPSELRGRSLLYFSRSSPRCAAHLPSCGTSSRSGTRRAAVRGSSPHGRSASVCQAGYEPTQPCALRPSPASGVSRTPGHCLNAHSRVAYQPLTPAPSHREFCFRVQSVNTLHVHLVPTAAEHRVQSSIPVARLLPCQLQQCFAQLHVAVRPRLIAITRPVRA